MKIQITFFSAPFIAITLLFMGDLKAGGTSLKNDNLSILLTPAERALVEKEASKQSQQKEKRQMPKADLSRRSANPYAELLEENGVKVNKDQQDTPSKKAKRRSTYSTPENYKRYKTGNRRPADALKSTPAQRAFGN